jgi:hypothetical protein
MIHITQACVDALAARVNEIDSMIVQADVDNDKERADHHHDLRRLERYKARRRGLITVRDRLRRLYVEITNKDPWEGVPF